MIVRTYSGIMFDILDPKIDDIKLTDIIYSLSNMCRFNGHSKRFYSVAQHSLHVSELLSGTGVEFEGLFHDSAEVYLGDIVSPIKEYLYIGDFPFKDIENNLLKLIAEKFGFYYPLPKIVKETDETLLCAEQLLLMNYKWKIENYIPCIEKIPLMSILEVRQSFQDRFSELTT